MHYFETCIEKRVDREISVLITKVGSEGSHAYLHPSSLATAFLFASKGEVCHKLPYLL